MQALFFLEVNSKAHLSLGELGNVTDVFHWESCEDAGSIYFDVSVIKLHYEIWGQNPRF